MRSASVGANSERPLSSADLDLGLSGAKAKERNRWVVSKLVAATSVGPLRCGMSRCQAPADILSSPYCDSHPLPQLCMPQATRALGRCLAHQTYFPSAKPSGVKPPQARAEALPGAAEGEAAGGGAAGGAAGGCAGPPRGGALRAQPEARGHGACARRRGGGHGEMSGAAKAEDSGSEVRNEFGAGRTARPGPHCGRAAPSCAPFQGAMCNVV